ncbi:MAG: hypothetical protein OXE95_06790 [Chloroflexi bacterium]|nr:hypothetical protein [Chloroflexota bacterium]MCY4247266.1 hypothetical protein [Chloroflexota bacterium]
MDAIAEIRYQRVEAEYQAVRQTQDRVLNRVDGYEAALLALAEQAAENSRKLDAIIAHLQVPYEKQDMGFLRNRPTAPDS